MWKIGELARRTGLTVRTLHHYDEIRLLSPAERSDGGHRVYGEADVGRLYRIVSLRSLGFPLDAIAAALDEEDFDPRAAVEDHLARLEAQMEQQRQLQARLRRLLERLDTDDFLTTIEEMTMRQRYYTPEQLDQLEQRRQSLGEDAIRDVECEWAEIFAEAPPVGRARPGAHHDVHRRRPRGSPARSSRCGRTRTPSRSPAAWSTPR
jgi:MerR family transcriptional regulator, thiopeptide resistance regulator